MSRNPLRKASGFSLVELLIVIAIIGVLIGMLIPAIQQARWAALRQSDNNNLHQLGTAIANYETNYGQYPCEVPGTGVWANQPVSMFTQLLPFVDQENYYQEIMATAPLVLPSGMLNYTVELDNAYPGGIIPIPLNSVSVKPYLCPGRRTVAPGKVDYAAPSSDANTSGSTIMLQPAGWVCCSVEVLVDNPLSGYVIYFCDWCNHKPLAQNFSSVLAPTSSPVTAGMVATQRGASYSMLLSEKSMNPALYQNGIDYFWDPGFTDPLGGGLGGYAFDHVRPVNIGMYDFSPPCPDSQLNLFGTGTTACFGTPFNALPLLMADGSVRHLPTIPQLNGGVNYSGFNNTLLTAYSYYNTIGVSMYCASCGICYSNGMQAVDTPQ